MEATTRGLQIRGLEMGTPAINYPFQTKGYFLDRQLQQLMDFTTQKPKAGGAVGYQQMTYVLGCPHTLTVGENG